MSCRVRQHRALHGNTQRSMRCRFPASWPQPVASAGGCAQRRACLRQPSARGVLARSSASEQSDRMLAPEMLWLFEGRRAEQPDMQPMLDAVWTLQYQIPGAICGFAGEVAKLKRLPGARCCSQAAECVQRSLRHQHVSAHALQAIPRQGSHTPSICVSRSCTAW